MLDFHMWCSGFGVFVIVCLIILGISGAFHTDRTQEYQARTEMMQQKEQLIKEKQEAFHKRMEDIKNDHRSLVERGLHELFRSR